MTPGSATDGFDDLARQRQRESAHANCRIILLGTLATVATCLVILVVIDATRTSASRHYAASVAWRHEAAKHCDAALGRHRFWVGGTVEGAEMCTTHNISKSQVRGFDDATLSFLVIGDWGRDGMCCQRDVAAEMSIAAQQLKPEFVISTGDNFYKIGIDNASDPQIDRSWRDVYISPHKNLQNVPWKVILGNHDHVKSVDAQVALSKVEKLWHMPDRYFFETSKDGQLFMAFLDTTVMYYPKRVLQTYFSGDTITTGYRDRQLQDLKKAMSESTAEWKIVFGHHPFFASAEHGAAEPQNLKRLQTTLMPILKEHNVSAYFCGHEHTLEHHIYDGIHFFVSGAGSKIRPLLTNMEQSVFALDRQGYMAVSLRPSSMELRVQVVDLDGYVVHVARVKLS